MHEQHFSSHRAQPQVEDWDAESEELWLLDSVPCQLEPPNADTFVNRRRSMVMNRKSDHRLTWPWQ